jgi:hypothetical protein
MVKFPEISFFLLKSPLINYILIILIVTTYKSPLIITNHHKIFLTKNHKNPKFESLSILIPTDPNISHLFGLREATAFDAAAPQRTAALQALLRRGDPPVRNGRKEWDDGMMG